MPSLRDKIENPPIPKVEEEVEEEVKKVEKKLKVKKSK